VEAFALAMVVAASAGLTWYGLASLTGLIYHFMPGAPFLAAAGALRWRAGPRPLAWARIAILLGGAGLATLATLLALQAAAKPLDAPAITATVAAGGAVGAGAWLRRTKADREG
jgi:hypothetical protein